MVNLLVKLFLFRTEKYKITPVKVNRTPIELKIIGANFDNFSSWKDDVPNLIRYIEIIIIHIMKDINKKNIPPLRVNLNFIINYFY